MTSMTCHRKVVTEKLPVRMRLYYFSFNFEFNHVLEKLQKRAFDLVSNAYTSIRADDLALLMGVNTEAAISGE